MNRIYRLVWSRGRRALVVASELATTGSRAAASGAGGRALRGGRGLTTLAVVALAAGGFFHAEIAWADAGDAKLNDLQALMAKYDGGGKAAAVSTAAPLHPHSVAAVAATGRVVTAAATGSAPRRADARSAAPAIRAKVSTAGVGKSAGATSPGKAAALEAAAPVNAVAEGGKGAGGKTAMAAPRVGETVRANKQRGPRKPAAAPMDPDGEMVEDRNAAFDRRLTYGADGMQAASMSPSAGIFSAGNAYRDDMAADESAATASQPATTAMMAMLFSSSALGRAGAGTITPLDISPTNPKYPAVPDPDAGVVVGTNGLVGSLQQLLGSAGQSLFGGDGYLHNGNLAVNTANVTQAYSVVNVLGIPTVNLNPVGQALNGLNGVATGTSSHLTLIGGVTSDSYITNVNNGAVGGVLGLLLPSQAPAWSSTCLNVVLASVSCWGVNAAQDYQVLMGDGASANGSKEVVIGTNASHTLPPQNAADAFPGAGTNDAADPTGVPTSDYEARLGHSVVVGDDALGTANGQTILGAEALSSQPNSVALGYRSNADRGPQQGYVAYGLAAVQNSAGEVAVGTLGNERQITHVAAGSANTDAVNVAQLQGAVSQINDLGNFAVLYDTDGNGLPNYTHVTLGGGLGSTVIGGLAPGEVAAGSTEAVNGAQLAATNGALAGYLGGSTAFNPITNSWTGPVFAVPSIGTNGGVTAGNYGNVTDAFGAVGGSLDNLNTQISNIQALGITYFHANSTGPDSQVIGLDSVAIGPSAMAAADNSIAAGNNAQATDAGAVAIGAAASAGGGAAVAIGAGNAAFGEGAVALGDPNYASGTGAYAAGADNIANSDGSASATGANQAQGAVAIGDGNVAIGQGSVALGNDSTAGAPGALAFGDTARAVNAGDVALGSGTLTAAAVPTGTATLNGVTYAFAGATPTSVVSVGAAGAERQIQNVAAGQLNAGSTDAVNGSQLFATNEALSTAVDGGGIMYFHANSTGPDSVATGTDSVAIGPGAQAANAGDVALGANALTAAAVATPNAVINGTLYAFAGAGPLSTVSLGAVGAERTLTNLAAGRLAGGSTDAVNGSQLFATNQAVDSLGIVVNNLSSSGGDIRYFHVNSAGPDSVAGGAGSVAGGAGASSGGVGSVALGNAASAANDNSVALGAGSTTSVGAQQGYTGAYAATGSSNSVGEVSVGSAGAERKVTNVADGSDAHDAANVGQVEAGVGYAIDQSKAYTDQQIINIGNGAASMFAVKNTSNLALPLASGDNSAAGGAGATAAGANSSALGNGAQAQADNSVALGAGSVADRSNSVSVGSAGAERQITNVAAGIETTDAVNLGQLKSSQQGSVRYDVNSDGSINYDSATLGQAGSGTTVVHNVGAGSAATDAVNVDQLSSGLKNAVNWANSYTDQRIDALDRDVQQVGNRANAGVASAMAMAGLPQAFEPGRSMAAVAASGFRGESSLAVGVSMVSEGGRWVYKLTGSSNTRGDAGVSIGAGMQW